ncbi:Vacuolar ATPase assembly integral membrane protein VMA21 [Tolypocladium ophioglossoides CBS 100239]|uniref:Vacuolar ATPase assembly integral membrane protein VMA21 n=1 Tax=Tolypocladium ophioglossoides (strain CBS 100239) TaxID=1163406 RepID=A0A0L0N3N4_TOLOC|nr:Vacuolar ATPase assembly integral membrane protein VMA21 [Tolypocladium ophioglossoides CBS 100239]
MATQRIISSEKTILEKDDQTEEKSNISPAVPKHVIFKLLGFTFAMIVFPIGSYFITVNTVFKGNSSYAGALAALLANVVLIAYVIVAMNEDESEGNGTSKSESKKDR